ncbi:MAG: TonB-dependent receptor [Planctomycetota bacterium]|nr:TonB-dependent receptor [Planctomycetota bacterium]
MLIPVPLLVAVLAAQPGGEEATPQDDPVQTTVVTPTAGDRPLVDSPATIQVIDATEISEQSLRTLPQALRNTPGVMVQETAHGHGSPYLRGFTSFRNLLLVDGWRLNNSVFRPGPNQYWNTVDAQSLERLEVSMGPSSVLYGSDALGGTVHAISKGPRRHANDGKLHGSLTYLYADAANYDQVRAEIGGWLSDRTGVHVGVSSKDFGDLHGGKDVGLQRETGYDESALDVKVEHDLDDGRLTFAHQRVAQRDVPRTHRTIYGLDWEGLEIGSDLEREFDQDRRLTYLQLEDWSTASNLFDELRLGISYHEQDEVRDRTKGSGAVEQQGFDVGTLGLLGHFRKEVGAAGLLYGLEYYRDDVDSFLAKASGNSAADDIQGPIADDATYETLGLFLQGEIEVSERLDLIAGARWNYAHAQSDSVRDPVTDTAISIDEHYDAIVTSLRFVVELESETRLFGGVSQGFRAPNLSDLSRFDSAKSNEFEVPSTDLDPERTTTLEFGARREAAQFAYQSSVFFTQVDDRIQRFPTGLVNGDGDTIVTKDNIGDGEVYGLELSGSYQVAEDWSVFGNLTLLDGEISNFPTAAQIAQDEPLTRQMPTTIQLGARWDDARGKLWSEALLTWADDADDLSSSDLSDTTRIPLGGTPGYTVIDLRAGYRHSDAWSFQMGLENITDEDYRIHGSGLNRPGRNFLFGVTFSF